MAELFANGRMVDLVMLLTLLEGLGLMCYFRVTGRGLAPRDCLPNLASGILLLLAVRNALTGSAWWWISGYMLIAGVVHGFDVWLHWRGSQLTDR